MLGNSHKAAHYGAGWGRGEEERGSEDNVKIHTNVSSSREVKLALFRSKKFSSGITTILLLNKGVVSTKTFRQRNSEIRDLGFLYKISIKRARTSLYTRMLVMI